MSCECCQNKSKSLSSKIQGLRQGQLAESLSEGPELGVRR